MIKNISPINKIFYIWLAMATMAAIFLAQTNFVSESNDSKFYTRQVITYHNSSWEQMLTPKWNKDSYGEDPNAYMRDQLPGQLLLGIALTKMGLPPAHALHILELFFQIFSVILIFKIASYFIDEKDALIIVIGLLFFPFAFSYNIRANHESGILFFCTLALFSGIHFNRHLKYPLYFILSSSLLLLIKGPFIIFAFGLCTLGYLSNKNWELKPAIKLACVFLFALIINILWMYWFEQKFLSITGESFFKEFVRIQFQDRALNLANQHAFLIQKTLNIWYYINHCITYSLPWSLLALIAFIIKKVKKNTIAFYQSTLSYLLLSSSLIFCLVFGMSNRIAGRYIHPAYYFFTAWCILFSYYNLIAFKSFFQNLSISKVLVIINFLWFLAFAIHFVPNF